MNRSMRVLVVILIWIITARGVDYSTGNSHNMGRLWGDHLTMPELWGAACLVIAALATIGLIGKWPRLVANTALWGMATSVMFAVQVADARMFRWPPEDIRIITDHLGHAAIWLLVAVTILYRLGVENRKAKILEEADG